MKRVVIIASAIIMTFVVPYGIAKVMSEWAMGLIDGVIKLSVEGNYFLSALSHRAFQLVVAIILLRLILKWEAIKRLFRLEDLRKGIEAFRGVIIFWPMLTILFLRAR